MADTFYRATLHLEKVEPYTDDRGHAHARITEIAALGFTGADADDAMYQMRNHVETLHDWHETQADQVGALDEAFLLSDSDLLARLRVMFEHQDELTAREVAKKVVDDIVAAEQTPAGADDEGDELADKAAITDTDADRDAEAYEKRFDRS